MKMIGSITEWDHDAQIGTVMSDGVRTSVGAAQLASAKVEPRVGRRLIYEIGVAGSEGHTQAIAIEPLD